MNFSSLDQSIFKRQAYAAPGNTLAEYAAIGALIVVVVIVGLQAAAGNLNDIFALFKDEMNARGQITAVANAAQQESQSTFSAAAPNQVKVDPTVPPLPPAQVLADTSTIADTASSSGSATQTAGGNGNTQQQANTISTMGKQALSAGKITQEEYNTIVKLANKGHDIGAIQGLLETAYTNSQGNASTYANTVLSFNGVSYTPTQLNSILESNIGEFSELRKNASVLNGVLYEAPLLDAINNSGGNIINNGYASQQQNQTAASFIQYQSEGVGGGSADTHGESAVICTNGQHLDVNNHCVP